MLFRKYILILFLFTSCNPVKQVLSNDVRFNKVAKEVVRRGYCITERTTDKIVRDTVIVTKHRVKQIDRIVKILPKECALDTVFEVAKGLSIQIQDRKIKVLGHTTTKTKEKIIEKTVTIRDRKLENILNEDINNLKDKINKLHKKQTDITAKYQELLLQKKAAIGAVVFLLAGYFTRKLWLGKLL